jgi:hypothetical protein
MVVFRNSASSDLTDASRRNTPHDRNQIQLIRPSLPLALEDTVGPYDQHLSWHYCHCLLALLQQRHFQPLPDPR